MAAIQQTLPPIIAGVAQGTDSQVSAGNLRVCDNFIPDLVWGLAKRPGSELVSSSLAVAKDSGTWFDIKLGDEESYLVHVGRNGNVKVVDAYSGEQPSMSQQSASYLAHSNLGDIEALQVGDFIFLLNRAKTVAKAAALTPNRRVHAWAEVRAISYDTTYTVRITATGETPITLSFATAASGSITVNTITNGLVASAPGSMPYVIARIGNTVSVRWSNAAETKPIKIEASGGLVGDAIVGYSGQVSSIQELPSVYAGNRPVLVKPTNSTGPGYWVEFSEADADEGIAGVWTETVQRNEQFRLNASTMPHVLVKRADQQWFVKPLDGTTIAASTTVGGQVTEVSPTGPFNGTYWVGQTFYVLPQNPLGGRFLRLQVTGIDSNAHPTSVVPIRPGFSFLPNDVVLAANGDQFTVTTTTSTVINNPTYANLSWTDRAVGSQESVPWPSFVDRRITGIGFYLNRLVFLSEDNVITSKAGDYLNFFPTTAIQVLSDDPVDINTGETTRTVLRHTVLYNNRLICISQDKQYSLVGGDDGFTPSSARLTVSSRVKTSTITKPLTTQLSWLVVEETNSGVELIEMFPNADEDPNLSRPTSVSQQAPTYVPRGVTSSALDSDLGLVALVSRQEPGNIYLWKWVDQARQRLMAAWCRINVPLDVQHVYFLDNYLYMVGLTTIPTALTPSTVLARIPIGVVNPAGRLEFDGFRFSPRLDLMSFTVNGTYDLATDTTRIPVGGSIYNTPTNLPKVFALSGPNQYVVYEPGYNDNDLILPGNVGTNDVVLGYSYKAEALLPHIYLRGEGGAGVTANVPKVRRITVRSFRSGGFGASITVPSRPTYTQECGQAIPNQYNLGQLIMKRINQVTVPTMCDGDDMEFRIITSCPLPVHIQEVTWKGTYTTKGLRSQ